MKNSIYINLINKYNRNEANAEEIALVESWYLYKINHTRAASTDIEYPEKKQKIFSKIYKQINHRKIMWRFWSKAAAAVLLLIGVGFLLKWNAKKGDRINGATFVIKNDIAPGSNAATLILENGKKITLNATKEEQQIVKNINANVNEKDGVLYYNVSNVKGSEHTLVTANGQNYRLVLPDGTLVWLNAASSIRYPASFASASARKVQLTGEAYFEVAKDKKHPFVVETKLQRIEVLGTHFNVSSYSGAQAKTTLVEGKVNVFDKRTQHYQKLEAGQQGISDKEGLQTIQVNTELQTAWKNGDFTFQGDDFNSALLKVSRWYNVEIIFQDDLSGVMLPGGWISKNSKLSEVLKLIAITADLRFKIEERRVTIARK